MKLKAIYTMAAVAMAATALIVELTSRTKWQRAFYKDQAAHSQAVQVQAQRQAEQEARHKAELQTERAKVASASAAEQAATTYANRIRIMTDRELADLRAAAIPDRDKILALSAEIDVRGRKILALQLVVERQVVQVATLNGLISTMDRHAAEVREQREKDHVEFQGVVAQSMQLRDELRKRIIVYVGVGESVDVQGNAHFGLHAGVGILIKRVR